MTDLARWPDADSLLDQALALPPAERAAFVRGAAGGDAALVEALDAILREADRGDDFLAPGGALSGPLFGALCDELDAAGDTPTEAALEEGRRLGPYRVDHRIGRGGMGEVFRARDLRLGRDVAIKVLPALMADDPDRLARLEREARALAAVSHPGVATIHDVYEEPGLVALVLELVEGPTLAERIARGPVSWGEALPIVRQLVDAITAAHERGIVHRDLKPANVKLTPGGHVKVLDFGLARAVDAGEEGNDERLGPALTSMVRHTGLVLGTAAYMSPEQARGARVDHRTDIWAFGCVVYEMLAGERPFDGDSRTDVIARIIEREPDWSKLPRGLPPPVARLIKRCLRKDAAKRLGYLGDARLDLDDAEDGSEAAGTAAVPRRRLAAWLLAPAGVAAGVLLALAVLANRSTPPGLARLAIPLGADHDVVVGQLTTLARSGDGRTLVYRARRSGVMQLFVRRVDQAESSPLAGTEDAEGHAVSPDGRWVAFGRGGKLLKVPVAGGPPVVLADAPGGVNVAWGRGDALVFATGTSRQLLVLPAAGGTPRAIAGDPAGTSLYASPDVSPDGHAVAFTLATPTADQVAVTGLDGGEVRVLTEGRQPQFLPGGFLVFARESRVWAARYDARRRALAGEPVVVVEGVARSSLNRQVHFAAAQDGSLVYVPAGYVASRQVVVRVDRRGREEAVEFGDRPITRFALSPDGSRLALAASEPAGRDVWVLDRVRRTLGRLTSDPATETAPVWSPDGRTIAYRSDRDGGGIFIRAADGAAEPRRLTKANGLFHTPYAFTRDGTRLLFVEFKDYRQQNILSVATDGSLAVATVLGGANAKLRPALSPDGRWLAYQSDESGAYEVYVRPWPEVTRARWQVSTSGGTSPTWSRDGRELYFADRERLLAVPVAESGGAFSPQQAQPLFALTSVDDRLGPLYEVAPDGSGFFVFRHAPGAEGRPGLLLVQGWLADIEARTSGPAS
jgi:serine/threonine-protein kinase